MWLCLLACFIIIYAMLHHRLYIFCEYCLLACIRIHFKMSNVSKLIKCIIIIVITLWRRATVLTLLLIYCVSFNESCGHIVEGRYICTNLFIFVFFFWEAAWLAAPLRWRHFSFFFVFSWEESGDEEKKHQELFNHNK